MFLRNQSQEQKEKYIQLLASIGSLSRLFSDSDIPYLYYRAHENIFCLSLGASNKSRGDVAVDAVKDGVGIGLKTFLARSSQFEKIAEFNKLQSSYRHMSPYDLVRFIASARNERLDITSRLYGTNSLIYHCISRQPGKFNLFEVPMDYIDLGTITISSYTNNVINFYDNKNNYKFNLAKSTLFKRFVPENTFEFDVGIVDDPYSAILDLSNPTTFLEGIRSKQSSEAIPTETIILPLYSKKAGENLVPEKSGLNQWNAGGRARHPDEVYIPVPAWIHSVFPGFFPPRDVVFRMKLPNGEDMDAKICQDGGKALMSNPNKDLGRWLLRKVLDLPLGELLTYDHLLVIGVDSVMITKESNYTYSIDFKTTGTFEDFIEQNRAQEDSSTGDNSL